MKYTTKTEYGLICMIFLAKHQETEENRRMSIKEIAAMENYPVAYLEKILQALRQAKLVDAHQGTHGGYALARRPSEITLKEIIDALEGSTFEIFCQPEVREDIVCTHFCLCGVKPIWRKTRELLDAYFGSMTLEMLMRNELEVRGAVR